MNSWLAPSAGSGSPASSSTRLVVRVRADYSPSPRMALVKPFLGVLHELMERAQLRHLRQRIEAPAAPGS